MLLARKRSQRGLSGLGFKGNFTVGVFFSVWWKLGAGFTDSGNETTTFLLRAFSGALVAILQLFEGNFSSSGFRILNLEKVIALTSIQVQTFPDFPSKHLLPISHRTESRKLKYIRALGVRFLRTSGGLSGTGKK